MFPDLGIIMKKLVAEYATEEGGGETHRKQIKQNRPIGRAEAYYQKINKIYSTKHLIKTKYYDIPGSN